MGAARVRVFTEEERAKQPITVPFRIKIEFCRSKVNLKKALYRRRSERASLLQVVRPRQIVRREARVHR